MQEILRKYLTRRRGGRKTRLEKQMDIAEGVFKPYLSIFINRYSWRRRYFFFFFFFLRVRRSHRINISFQPVRVRFPIVKKKVSARTARAGAGASSYFVDRAARKQMRIMRGLSAQKVRSCFRCNLKLSGLRDQRRINRPSENRLGIPRA